MWSQTTAQFRHATTNTLRNDGVGRWASAELSKLSIRTLPKTRALVVVQDRIVRGNTGRLAGDKGCRNTYAIELQFPFELVAVEDHCGPGGK